jgi:SAM-dependent methyltransferase
MRGVAPTTPIRFLVILEDPAVMAATTYLFDNSTQAAAQQVKLLAETLDPHTQFALCDLDVPSDGTCLDLGAGGGSIADFMAHHVVPHGTVVALDADPRHITQRERLSVRAEDVMDADLEQAQFDLIHARLLFMHLPGRLDLLKRAVDALKPDGVLVLSDWDCTRPETMLVRAGDAQKEAFLAFQQALIGAGTAIGMDAGWAHQLPLALIDAGLEEVEAATFNQFWRGGEAGMQLHACNSHQKQAALLDAGMTEAQLRTLRDAMQDPAVGGYTYEMVTAVGRRR